MNILASKLSIGVVFIALLTMTFFTQAVELRGSHKENKVACKSCHIDGLKKPGKMEGCLNCHESYDALKALTADKGLEANPHDSHLGNLDCSDCHLIHKPSGEAICAECHNFDFVTP
ncbi:cytochrome c3 family protein [Shewanella sp. A14]